VLSSAPTSSSPGRRTGRFRRIRVAVVVVHLDALAHVRAASWSRDQFGSLLCVGVLAMIGSRFRERRHDHGHHADRGIPLPFMSYGGSAVIAPSRRRPGPQRADAPLQLTTAPRGRGLSRAARPVDEPATISKHMSSLWPQIEPLLARVQKRLATSAARTGRSPTQRPGRWRGCCCTPTPTKWVCRTRGCRSSTSCSTSVRRRRGTRIRPWGTWRPRCAAVACRCSRWRTPLRREFDLLAFNCPPSWCTPTC